MRIYRYAPSSNLITVGKINSPLCWGIQFEEIEPLTGTHKLNLPHLGDGVLHTVAMGVLPLR